MDLFFFQAEPAAESSLVAAEVAFVLLLALAALIAIFSRRFHIPYTVALVVVGLALTFIPNPFTIDLSSEFILFLLVPPLIFEATLNIKWETLRQNLGIILLLAVVGTMIGTIIVASILSLAGQTLVPELDIAFAATFAFGALISATDPVAVISLFRDLGTSKRLSILVEGESLFNDGVAIVIFGIAVSAGTVMITGEGENFTFATVIFEFLRVSFGGLAVGFALGYAISVSILKNIDYHLAETATTVALAFGTFIIAENLHVSGVLAVVAAGLVVGNIGIKGTSPTTRLTLENFWEFAAFVVNSMVFLLIGLDADLAELQPNLKLILVAVLAVILSRGVVVYGLTWIYNLVDPRRRISLPYRHIMYWGGLRGAISLALALSLTGSVFDDFVVDEIQLMTFGVVLFTLLIQATTITPLLRRMGLTGRSEQKQKQEKQQALLYATRAGKRELNRLYNDGILSVEVYEAMNVIYSGLIERHSNDLHDLLLDYPELEQTMILQARRDLIQAERAAIRDASGRGLISEEVFRELIQEMNYNAEALELIQEAMQPNEEKG